MMKSSPTAMRASAAQSSWLSAVRQADRALVFESGRIVEDGSHDDLMRNSGLYASLYRHAEPH